MRVIRPGDAPLEAATADGYIAQPAFHKALDFVHAVIGFHEIRTARIEFKEPLFERRELEEVIIFANQLGRAAADVAVHGFRVVGNITLVKDAVAALVAMREDIAIFSGAN